MNFTHLTEKKSELDRYRNTGEGLPSGLVKNLEDWFRVEITYTSNAIEGNTLTRRETALVVEKGLTVGGKSLQEHLEGSNHAYALDWIKHLAHRPDGVPSENELLQLHSLILRGIDDHVPTSPDADSLDFDEFVDALRVLSTKFRFPGD